MIARFVSDKKGLVLSECMVATALAVAFLGGRVFTDLADVIINRIADLAIYVTGKF